MRKVITYGTYDLLHYGHIRLLERAKALGDYLIVGVTANGFDQARGKINVQQSLMERIEALQATGLADEIVIEEYEGQKIDDIIKYNVDIFAIGSDWLGKFDYLKEYCEVVYLDRTQGVSSSDLRAEKREIVLGVIGNGPVVEKFVKECGYVNGVKTIIGEDYKDLVSHSDAVYIYSNPAEHYEQVKYALEHNKHVLCELPLTMNPKQDEELFDIAQKNDCILLLGCKTAYSTAYNRMVLLAKGGIVGDIISVDSTCTSLQNDKVDGLPVSSIQDWGPIALLPILQLLGTEYKKYDFITKIINNSDVFTKCNFVFNDACASVKVGNGFKSEGELIVSGTKGYIYVPAPWWKTDYFEVRFEDQQNNKRYFYQLDGEGIRNEIVTFVKSIYNKRPSNISKILCKAISSIIMQFNNKDNTLEI